MEHEKLKKNKTNHSMENQNLISMNNQNNNDNKKKQKQTTTS